ncbi:DinB family protein [Paenibacillus sp. FJAT-26967]|uniref:DinB family protein n=1 Tax=Paenibacillus sp. FJAT-26967 TaxID=1729690 RepID=UPI0008388C4A|nr:DinB family protein [Paenibacillus sp. FJAT-26967]
MFNNLSEFQQEWKNEAAITLNVLNALTDESLNQSIAADHFSLGELGWHLTVTMHGLLSAVGLQFEGPGSEKDLPESASAIAEAYERTSNGALEAIQTQWTDETLQQSKPLFGQEIPIFALLRMLLQHQVHHRGQMSVLMRQADLTVPGIYGPNKEQSQMMRK